MNLDAFISGAILLGYWAIGVFFSRFWRTSGERLFGFFAVSFWLLAVERLLFTILNYESGMRPFVYIIRLVAYLFILIAIIDKNRSNNPPGLTR